MSILLYDIYLYTFFKFMGESGFLVHFYFRRPSARPEFPELFQSTDNVQVFMDVPELFCSMDSV